VSDGSCNIVAIERKQLVNHVFTDESFLEYETEIHYIRNIHSKSTRDAFSLPIYTHALQKQLPRLSQAGAHSGLGLQADYRDHHTPARQAKAGQGKTIRDKPAPQQLPKGKPKPLPKPRADRWASAATGLTLQTLSEPFPSRQSINNSSFDTSHTSAYSFNQYDK
jgi:hypothetical protein